MNRGLLALLVGGLALPAGFVAGRVVDDGCPAASFCQDDDEWADVMLDGVESQNAAEAYRMEADRCDEEWRGVVLRAAQIKSDLDKVTGALDECRRGLVTRNGR